MTGSTGTGIASVRAVSGRRRDAEHVAQLVAFDHFLLEQTVRQLIENLAVLAENALCVGFGRCDEALALPRR